MTVVKNNTCTESLDYPRIYVFDEINLIFEKKSNKSHIRKRS